jgi:Mg2+ and Co2+ transporter CorA
MADNKNEAIFIFTSVTIVFLPLSSFTSYYGMNLQGMAGSSKTDAYFWKVGETSSFAIVLIVCLYAFRHHIRQNF